MTNDVQIESLTCDDTGDFGHETFDSSDGHTFSLVLDVSDNVFNLRRQKRRCRLNEVDFCYSFEARRT